MRTAQDLLDQQYLTMRERILSLAADFDRIERAAGGPHALASPKAADLYRCLDTLRAPGANRAEQVQILLSDRTPPPPRPSPTRN